MCKLQTPTTGRDASYKLNVVRRHVVAVRLVTLRWSETMGGYNTSDTMVEIGA